MFVILVKFSLFLSALSLTTIYMKGRLTPYGLTFRWTYLHIQVITIVKPCYNENAMATNYDVMLIFFSSIIIITTSI